MAEIITELEQMKSSLIKATTEVIAERGYSTEPNGVNLATRIADFADNEVTSSGLFLDLSDLEEVRNHRLYKFFRHDADDFRARHRLMRELLVKTGFIKGAGGLWAKESGRGIRYTWLTVQHPEKPLIADCFSNTADLRFNAHFYSGFLVQYKDKSDIRPNYLKI